MNKKTEAFEDKADRSHHFLSEVYAATISKETNYKIQVLNTSSIETVKTFFFTTYMNFFCVLLARFAKIAYLCSVIEGCALVSKGFSIFESLVELNKAEATSMRALPLFLFYIPPIYLSCRLISVEVKQRFCRCFSFRCIKHLIN